MVVWEAAILCPLFSSASDARIYGAPKLRFQKSFLDSYIRYFISIQAGLVMGIIFCGSNEVFISTLY